MKLTTNNFEETKKIGYELGQLCEGGEIFALSGELGAGKTILTKGLGEGLGIHTNIVSPTFMLVRTYKGAILNLIHFDFYRLDTNSDFYSIGFDDYLEKNNIIVIEWADKFIQSIPQPFIKIDIDVVDIEKRNISFEIYGNMKIFDDYLKMRCNNVS